MFTRNPITGADERMIEASWGLGEAVVAGRVIPDSFRVARGGEVLDRRAGLKKFAIRSVSDGGTVDEDVAPDLVESLCLRDEHLQALSALADDCERVYGAGRDIEWAFADGQLYLLQCRAVTRSAGVAPTVALAAPPVSGDSLVHVPLFSDLRRARSRRHRATVHTAGVRAPARPSSRRDQTLRRSTSSSREQRR